MGMLAGRVAICAGSGRGVGAEVAKLMAAHGAKVIVNDPRTSGSGEGSDLTPAQEIVDQIKAAGGDAAPNYGSVAKFDDCLAMVHQERRSPCCSVLMSSSSVSLRSSSPPTAGISVGFHFSASYTAHSRWNIMSFFEKAFLYGSVIWLLGRAGLRLTIATIIVATMLFVTSWAETYLAGRSAEITDAIMALLIGIIIGLIETPSRSSGAAVTGTS